MAFAQSDKEINFNKVIMQQLLNMGLIPLNVDSKLAATEQEKYIFNTLGVSVRLLGAFMNSHKNKEFKETDGYDSMGDIVGDLEALITLMRNNKLLGKDVRENTPED